MRKIFTILIVMLVASVVSSGQPPDRFPPIMATPAYARNLMVVGGGVPVSGAACSNATDYVGNKDATGPSTAYPANTIIYCNLRAATCPSTCATGTLDTAYVYKNEGSTSYGIKVGVFNATSTTPQGTSDTLVGTWTTVTQSANGFQSGAAVSGGTVTCGNNYWVCFIPDGNFAPGYDTGVATFYHGSVTYASPPTTLIETVDWDSTTYPDRSFKSYVTIK
jgi:hypothetical protein